MQAGIRPRPSRGQPVRSVPFALAAPGRHGMVLTAVNRQAEARGMAIGMRLADARALLPGLATATASPAEDRRGLERLAFWCNRFTPSSAVDGDDGLLLDITGAAHLFGGEAMMMAEVEACLVRLGIGMQAGLADTAAAAWALARFGGKDGRIAPPGTTLAALAPLPVEALRITAGDARLLHRLGLDTIGAVEALPPATLAHRFDCRGKGWSVPERLDRVFGRCPDPVIPVSPPPACVSRLGFPEPLTDLAGLEAALDRLVQDLCASLEWEGLGVRKLTALFFRVDCSAIRHDVSVGRATRNGAHLQQLLARKIGAVDPGFGIDAMALHAVRAEPLVPEQIRLARDAGRAGGLDLLIDRLQARLGKRSVFRLEPVESHLPERAVRRVQPGRDVTAWCACPALSPRPIRLFDRPEPVDGVAGLPDGPPMLFTWHRVARRVVRAEGPERIEPEWWAGDPGGGTRDYYRIEDMEGRRYWLYRMAGCEGSPRWYIHGLYG